MITEIEAKEMYPHLLKFSLYLKVTNSIIEDLVQETLMKACIFFKEGNLKTWCFQVIKREYITYLRTNVVVHELLVLDIPTYSEVVEQIYCKELGLDWYNWPGKEYKNDSERNAKARARMAKNYLKKKASLTEAQI